MAEDRRKKALEILSNGNRQTNVSNAQKTTAFAPSTDISGRRKKALDILAGNNTDRKTESQTKTWSQMIDEYNADIDRRKKTEGQAKSSIVSFDEKGNVSPWQTLLNIGSDLKKISGTEEERTERAKTLSDKRDRRVEEYKAKGYNTIWLFGREYILGKIKDEDISEEEKKEKSESAAKWEARNEVDRKEIENISTAVEAAKKLGQQGIPTYAVKGSKTQQSVDDFQNKYAGKSFGEKLRSNVGITAGNWALDISSAALSGADLLTGGQLGKGKLGKASSVYSVLNLAQSGASGLAGNAFGIMRENSSFLGKLVLDIEKSGVEQILDRLTGGGLVTMGVRVAGGTLQQGEDKGQEIGKNILTTAVRTGIEVFTEMMSGIGGSYTGKGWGDSILDALNRKIAAKTGSELLGTLAEAFGGEAVEEMTSDILNPIFDWIFGLEGEEYEGALDFIGSTLYDGLVGGLSGMTGGVGTAAMDRFSARQLGADIATYKVAQHIVESDRLRKNFEKATGVLLSEDEGKALVQTAVVLTAMSENRKQTRNADRNIRSRKTEVIEESLKKLGVSERAAKIIRTDFLFGDTAPETYAHGVEEAFTYGKNGISLEEAKQRGSFINDLSEVQARHAYELGQMTKNTRTEEQNSAENGDMEGAEESTEPNAAEELTVESAAASYGEDAEKFIDAFGETPEADIEEFARDFKKAYNFGLSGMNKTSLTRAETLTESQRDAAYAMGRAKSAANAQRKQEAINAGKQSGNRHREGTVRGDGVKLSDLRAHFNDKQNTAYRFLATFAKISGIDIVLYKSEADGNGKFTAPAGRFELGENTIYIDINAGLEKVKDVSSLANYTMLRTFSHEFTHFVEKWSPEQYNTLREFTFRYMDENGRDVDSLIMDKMSLDESLSYEEASREVVAEGFADILPQSDIVERLAAEHKSLHKSILRKMKEFVARIKAYFNGLKETTPEAQALKNGIAYAEEIVKLWTDAGVDAVNSYNATFGEETSQSLRDNSPRRGANGRADRGIISSYDNFTGEDADRTFDEYGGDLLSYEEDTDDEPEKRKVRRDRFPANDYTSREEEAPRLADRVPKKAAVSVAEMVETGNFETEEETAEESSEGETKKQAKTEKPPAEESASEAVPPKEETEEAKDWLKEKAKFGKLGEAGKKIFEGLKNKTLTADNITLIGKVDGFNNEQRAYLAKELIEGTRTENATIRVSVPFDGKFEIRNDARTVTEVLESLKVRVMENSVIGKKLDSVLKYSGDRIGVIRGDGISFITEGKFAAKISEETAELAAADETYGKRNMPLDKVTPLKSAMTEAGAKLSMPREGKISDKTPVYAFETENGIKLFNKKYVDYFDGYNFELIQNGVALKVTDENGDFVGYIMGIRPKSGTNVSGWVSATLKSFKEKKTGKKAAGKKASPTEATPKKASAKKTKKAAEKKAETSEKPPVVETTAKLEDFGEKIGGARKDWRSEGLYSRDLEDMNERERAANVKKDNVWKKPDYRKLIAGGASRAILYARNEIRKSLNAKLDYRSTWDEHTVKLKQQKYVDTIREIQKLAEKAETKADLENMVTWLVRNGYLEMSTTVSTTEKWRSNPALFTSTYYQTLNHLIRNFDKLEKLADKSNFAVDKDSAIPAGFNISRNKGENATWYITKGNWIIRDNFLTYEDALNYLKEAQQRKTKKTRFVPEQLLSVHRKGPDYRGGKNVDGQAYIDTFGFKGGEYGNWMTQKDRQASLDYGYDALMDLSDALGVPPTDISFGGNLNIAFGARGQGLSGASAHYEPTRHVINLTKMNGAGSLAHEWFHALDDFVGGYKDSFATSKYYRLPERTKNAMSGLVQAMKYTDQTAEEADLSKQHSIERAINRVNYELGTWFRWVNNMRDGTITDGDTKYFSRKPTAEDVTKFDVLKERILDGDMSAIDELSSLQKDVTGHVIAKENREYLRGFSAMLTPEAREKTIIGRKGTQYYADSQLFDNYYNKDGDYWSSTVEMAARAFACYITDKTGKNNDYLSAHSDSAKGLVEEANGNFKVIYAFPRGEERAAINKAFDNLIDAMKADGFLHTAEETEKPYIVQYSRRPQPDTDAKTEEAIQNEFNSDGEENKVQFSRRVRNPETLKFLNDQLKNGDVIHTYKTFLEVDENGEKHLYPPMAVRQYDESGKITRVSSMAVGEWEESIGNPNSKNIFYEINSKGEKVWKYRLQKDAGEGTVPAAYDPYQHSSDVVLNDQFEKASQRPGLVTYECIIPKSELTSRYHYREAREDGEIVEAALPVGQHEWKKGTVASSLKNTNRSVFLTRWLMPFRRLEDSETAQKYKDILDREDEEIAIPFNVVTPSLQAELEKIGVPINYKGSPNYQSWQRKNPEKYPDGKPIVKKTAAFDANGEKTQYSRRPVPQSEIDAIQQIPRKSVNEFSSSEIRKLEKYAEAYFRQMGVKSPFFRAWFGDWRANDKTPVVVAEKRGNDRGMHHNDDTGWDINVSGKVFEETNAHTASFNNAAKPYLQYINDIIKNAVLLDTFSVGGKCKSINSLLMHSMYAVADTGSGKEVIKLYVEEMNDPNSEDTSKRAYQLQNIERYQIQRGSSHDSVSSVSAVSGIKNVSDLFAYVKSRDRNFNPKPSSKMVDDNGMPLIMYHGTNNDFDVFQGEGHESFNSRSVANWFTDSEKIAGTYAPGGHVMSLYLDLKKPLIINAKGLWHYNVTYRGNKGTQKIAEMAKRRGYDGVIFKNIRDYSAWYSSYGTATVAATFKSNQSKSAYDNIGTFDSGDERIQYQQRGNSISDSDVLEYAVEKLDTAKLTDAERDALNIFKRDLERLRELEADRAEQGRIYKEQMFNKGGDHAEAVKVKNRMDILDKKINSLNNTLLMLQNKEVLRKILSQARTEVEGIERAKAKERLAAFKMKREDTESRRKYRKRVETEVTRLSDMLLKPADKNISKRVPAAIQKTVSDLLSSIDFSTPRLLKNEKEAKLSQKDKAFAKKLQAVQNAIKENIELKGAYSGYADLPPNFMEDFQKLIDGLNDLISAESENDVFVVNRMSAKQLKGLSSLLKDVRKYIENMNRFHENAIFRHAYEAGEDTVQHLRPISRAEQKKGPLTRIFNNFLAWQYMRPAVGFERFGKGGMSIYHEFRDGQATQAFLANKIIEFAKETYTEKQVREWSEKTVSVELDSGETVTMPVAMAMSFYELAKRPQAKTHIFGDGIRIAAFEDGKKLVQDEGHIITIEDAQRIGAVLKDEQIKVADALQAFMRDECAAWGNYVTMARFEREVFGEEWYFPINSDGRYLAATAEESPDSAALYALLNMGFTKELKENATNRIIIYNIFDVFANHAASMAQYRAFALPVLDALKWFNYSDVDTSVRDEMAKAFGVPTEKRPGSGNKGYAESFVLNLLKAYNGTTAHSDSYDAFGMKGLHRFNRAQVAYNLRVVAQQPLAITRAAMILPPAKLTKGLGMSATQLKKLAEEMEAHSGIAAWKKLGFYDTNISRGLTALIKHEETFGEKFTEVGMSGAELADRYTWAAMWYAAKDTISRADYSSEEAYFKAVTDLFEQVIYKTQVVDSVLTKSEFLRAQGFGARFLGSFMSEPSATVSMLMDGLYKYADDMARGMSRSTAWQRNKEFIGKTFLVYGVGQVLLAAVQSVADAWRDDDDYESFLEKLLEAFKGNVIDELNPIGKIPIAKDAIDLIKTALSKIGFDTYGNSISGGWMQYADYLIKSVEIFHGLKTKDDRMKYTLWGGIYNLLRGVAGMTGYPIATLSREVIDAWNNIVGAFRPDMKIKTYDPGDKNEIKYAYQDGYLTREEAMNELVRREISEDRNEAFFTVESWDSGELSVYAQLYEAAESGDTAAFNSEMSKLTTHGKKKEEVIQALRQHVRDGYLEGSMTASKAKSLLTRFTDDSPEDADARLDNWDFSENNPSLDWEYATVNTYLSEIKPSGISMSVYDKYLKGYRKCTGEDANGDGKTDSGSKRKQVLSLIDSLDLTPEQKDVLYYKNNYAASRINEAPWR